MKILELRFKNLNSLYGEWRIDFSQPAYEANGLFAITGPTGAGKSTILDALCLALYGRTPRLDRIGKNGNEIMSRQTGECLAEVVFSTQGGIWRCTWSQHRARKRADGRLADASHEIADALTGQVLEAKKTAALAVIEEKTGMDMDRFTRSVLLAQGGFAAFMQASPDERAPILEQITGTEIYSEISKKIYERQKIARSELDLLQAEVSGIAVLDDQETASLSARMELLQAEELAVSASLNVCRLSITWLQGLADLRNQISQLTEEAGNLSRKAAECQPLREKLELAVKAAELEGDYATLQGLHNQLEFEENNLAGDLRQKPRLETDLADQDQILTKAQAAVKTAKQNILTMAPLLREIRALDLKINHRQNQCAELAAEIRQLDSRAEEIRLAREKLVKDRADLTIRQEKLIAGQSERAADEMLVSQLAGISEKLSSLLGLANELNQIGRELRLVEERLQQARQDDKNAQKDLEDRNAALSEKNLKLEEIRRDLAGHLNGRTLRDYRHDQQSLLRELARQQKIAGMAEERLQLADGVPCPLCGATDHPFAAGNIPSVSDAEKNILKLNLLILAAEEMEESLQTGNHQLADLRAACHQAEKRQSETAANVRRIEDDLTRSIADQAAKLTRFDSQRADILAILAPLGIVTIERKDIREIRDQLTDRHDQWLALKKEQDQLFKESLALAAEELRLETRRQSIEQLLSERQPGEQHLRQELEQLGGIRGAKFGEQDPDLVEKKHSDELEAAEKEERDARDQQQLIKDRLNQILTRVSQREAAKIRIKSELARQGTEFETKLAMAGFADERQFADNRLQADERRELERLIRELDNRIADNASRLADRQSILALESAKALTTAELNELLLDQAKMDDEIKRISRDIGAILQTLTENARLKSEIEKKLAQISVRRNEWSGWNRINNLIGSADGKKYRNYAQGITFEMLIAQANHQLERLTDRYLLIHDPELPLELSVVDNYQAGEIRTTRNLSGGESFLVSLALALGLSGMSSRNVRVDSLFLDEGFGTLDEDSLETALETLVSLQQEGKLIGIISHVAALKERIGIRIEVSPASGGRSILSGPGVSRWG